MRRAVTGSRAWLSTTTRQGSRGHGRSSRTSRAGSSASAVPIPTTTASASLRRRCASARAASPVIQREDPSCAAIFPSSVIARLQGDVGAQASHGGEKGPVEVARVGFTLAQRDGDARRAQGLRAAAGHARVGVPRRPHDAREPCRDHGGHAGRRPSRDGCRARASRRAWRRGRALPPRPAPRSRHGGRPRPRESPRPRPRRRRRSPPPPWDSARSVPGPGRPARAPAPSSARRPPWPALMPRGAAPRRTPWRRRVGDPRSARPRRSA